MGVLGEGLTLVLRQRPAEPSLDLPEVPSPEKLPGEMAAEGSHDRAATAGHDGGGFLQRDQVSRPPMAVGDEDVPEARPRQRVPVVHHHVPHQALPHPDGADRVEGEAAEMQGRRQDHVPSRPRLDDLSGQRFREMAGREGVDANRQVRPMLLQRADRQDDDRPLPGQRVERRTGQLFEQVDAQNVLPRVRVR